MTRLITAGDATTPRRDDAFVPGADDSAPGAALELVDDAPSDDVATDQLEPLISGTPGLTRHGKRRGRPPKGSAPTRRGISRAEKDKRNQRMKELRSAAKREREAAESAERAARIARGEVDKSTSTAGHAAPSTAARAAVPAADVEAAALADDQLYKLVGLACHAIAKAVPPKYGGGTLTEDERELLGRSWADVLKPYLSGPGGPAMVAGAATLQVFALRAILYQPSAAEPVTHRRPDPAAVPSAPPAPSAALQEEPERDWNPVPPGVPQYDEADC